MKLTWQVKGETDESDPAFEAIQVFKAVHHHLLEKLFGKEFKNRIDAETYLQTLSETLCCFLHLTDRQLFSVIPEARQWRMDRMVIEAIREIGDFLEQFYVADRGKAREIASEEFQQTYHARMDEYSQLLLEKIPLRYGRHLATALDSENPSYDITMKAQLTLMSYSSQLAGILPRIYRP